MRETYPSLQSKFKPLVIPALTKHPTLTWVWEHLLVDTLLCSKHLACLMALCVPSGVPTLFLCGGRLGPRPGWRRSGPGSPHWLTSRVREHRSRHSAGLDSSSWAPVTTTGKNKRKSALSLEQNVSHLLVGNTCAHICNRWSLQGLLSVSQTVRFKQTCVGTGDFSFLNFK